MTDDISTHRVIVRELRKTFRLKTGFVEAVRGIDLQVRKGNCSQERPTSIGLRSGRR